MSISVEKIGRLLKYQFTVDCIRFFPNDHSGLVIYSNLSGDTHFLSLDGVKAKELFEVKKSFTEQQIEALKSPQRQSQSLFRQMLEKKIITQTDLS